MKNIFQTLWLWGSLVKFSHSVFALPFALGMLLVTSKYAPVSVAQIVLIILCVVSARTAAMAFNRLVDRKIDAANARTAGRELPAKKLSVLSVALLLLLSSLLFLLFASALGTHCLLLAPFVLAFLFFYSWTKRFSSYSHLVLGTALALAPGGVWYALTAQISIMPLYLMLAVIFWVAGFDIIYACQDREFDKDYGLHSIPVKLGIGRALILARIFHAFTLFFLVAFGVAASLHFPYFVGIFLFAIVLGSQHLIVSADDLSRVDSAFFTRNGLASLIFLLAVVAAFLI